LERWLQEEVARQGLEMRLQVSWLPKNASWLDQAEIWFSILQRKLLQPNHFGSIAELEQAIGEFIEDHNRCARPIRWTYTVEKLEKKLGIHL
jgi:hypothetical protein